MIAWWAAVAQAADVRFDRVDLLSESPGTWLTQEAPRLTAIPGTVAVRWVEQVAPVVQIGVVEVSASVAGQSVGIAVPLDPVRPAWFDAGVVARGLLPVGGRVGVAWGAGPVRLGLSAVALADATWVRPDYAHWSLVPAVGVGVGRYRAPGSPWMR